MIKMDFPSHSLSANLKSSAKEALPFSRASPKLKSAQMSRLSLIASPFYKVAQVFCFGSQQLQQVLQFNA